MIKHYIAIFYVPLDSDCCKLPFLCDTELTLHCLALGAVTEIVQTAFQNFVGGYFVVGQHNFLQ